jgi:subtilase family serine protease
LGLTASLATDPEYSGQISYLDVGQSETITLFVFYTNHPITSTIHAFVDGDNLIDEFDELNNDFQMSLQVI